MRPVRGRWYRTESREHFRQYLRSCWPLARRVWTISSSAGSAGRQRSRRFINLTAWDADGLRGRCTGLCDGVFRRSPGGADSRPDRVRNEEEVGRVQRQYSGRSAGSTTVRSARSDAPAAPETGCSSIEELCHAQNGPGAPMPSGGPKADVPEDLAFKTRPQQVQAMIDRTVEAGNTVRMVRRRRRVRPKLPLRRHLEEQQIAHLHGRAQEHHRHHRQPPGNKRSRHHRDHRRTTETPRLATPSLWNRIKGFRVYDWAVIEAPFPGHQYVVRRNINDGELAYFHCYNPCRRTVRVGPHHRFPLADRGCFEAAKQEAGLAQYQFGFTAPGTATSPWRCSPWLFLPCCTIPPRGRLWTTGSDRQHTTDGSAAITISRRTGTSTAGPATDQPVAEIRRLFDLIDKDDHAVELGLWSVLRRSHQAKHAGITSGDTTPQMNEVI